MPDVADIARRGGAKRPVGETRSLVLSLLEQRKRVREIARMLDVSEQNVRKHMAHLIADGEYKEKAS